jgi:hypothetical protein
MRCALLGDGTLLSDRRHGSAGEWTAGVCALTLARDALVFIAPGSADTRDEARRDADPSMLYLHRRAVHPSGIIESVIPLGACGSAMPRAVAFGGHLAWTLDDEVWRVGDETRHTALYAPANTRVIAGIERGNQAQLLLIEGDGRSLVRVGRSEEASLGRAACRIRDVRTAAAGDVFALLLEDGSVEIRGPFETAPRLVLRGAAQPPSPASNDAPAVGAEAPR